MGIRGLKKYVAHNGFLEDYTFPWKRASGSIPLRDQRKTEDSKAFSSPTNLSRADSKYEIFTTKNKPYNIVIDGRSILHHIYRNNFDCALGGQYSKFREKIIEFFGSLLKLDLEIIGLVLDITTGSPDFRQSESEDLFRRTSEVVPILKLFRNGPFQLNSERPREGPPLPRLCYFVLINTLIELGVPFYLTKALGDQSVASLAELTDAYVLSDDTDFMIYELTTGYLPLTDFNLETGTYEIYRAERFANHLNLPFSFLKLYAAAVGNRLFNLEDYRYLYPRINVNYFKAVHYLVWPFLMKCKHLSIPEALDLFLQHFYQKHMRGGPSLNEWKDRFILIMDSYTMLPSLTDIQTDNEFGPYGFGRLIPQYQFFKCDALLEDLSKPSAWIVSRRLRKLFYANYPEVGHVIEMIRTQTGDIEEYPVKVPSRPFDESIIEQLIKPYDGDGLVFALRYLIEYQHIRFTPLFAIAFAAIVPLPIPMEDMDSITFHLEMVHTIACLETTMISWSMATKKPLKRIVDSFNVHFFYEQLLQLETKISSFAIELLAQDHSEALLDFLKRVLGKDLDASEIATEDEEWFWIFDWN